MDARPNGDQPEILLHFAVAKLLREKCVWPLWSHWPSGEWRNREVARKLKQMGAKPGWPDFILINLRGLLHCLELKSATGELSEAQQEFNLTCIRLGIPYAVCRSFHEVEVALHAWDAIETEPENIMTSNLPTAPGPNGLAAHWAAIVPASGILGGLLGFNSKIGTWRLEGETAPEAILIHFTMKTLKFGWDLWKDHGLVDRKAELVESGKIPECPDDGEHWAPFTSIYGQRADDGFAGELVTFSSSSWAGRTCVTQDLVAPFYLRGGTGNPIVRLSKKGKTDKHGNHKPSMVIVGWDNQRGDPPALTTAEQIDDTIPF